MMNRFEWWLRGFWVHSKGRLGRCRGCLRKGKHREGNGEKPWLLCDTCLPRAMELIHGLIQECDVNMAIIEHNQKLWASNASS